MHNAHACKQHVQLLLVTLTLIFCFQYFEGNNDKNSEVKHVVYGVLTRFLRLLPKAHQGGECMRTEVFGVKSKPGNVKHLLFFN